MENKFDEQIKAAMQHLEVSSRSDWQRMEAALDGLDQQGTTATNDAFDTFVSNKLENFSTDIKMPDWNRMEAALNKEGNAQQLFDKEVKAKVTRIRPAYQPNHWELLAERLRREKAIKESLIKNKIAELVIFALLLLNFYPYLSTQQAVDSFPINTKPTEQKISAISPAVATVETSALPTINSSPYAAASKSTVQETKSVREQIVLLDLSNNNKEKAITNISTPDNRLFISPTLNPVAIKGVSSQPSLQQLTFGIDGRTGLTITVPEMTRHLAYAGLTNPIFVEAIPSLEPASLATASIPLGCEKCKRPKVPATFRFGMVAHAGATSAVRSANQILSITGLTQRGNGYGGGFTLGFKRGTAEIETGLIYAARSYSPNIDDAYKQGDIVNLKQFRGISLQTIRIPLNFRYNYAVFGKGKWHLYTQAGGAVNVILRAEYDIVDVPQVDNKFLNNIAASSRLARIKLNRGLLGGDTFEKNRFFTVNLGTGAEYYLTPKWSAFVEPEFNYYLSVSRIGPTKDRINSVSFSFGIRASFY